MDQSPTPKVKWGLLSTARNNRHVIAALKQSTVGELYGVASRTVDSAKAYAEANGIPKFYGSYEELLQDPSIQCVYVPLPNHLHKEWVVKALQAKKHVLCEKPMALTAKDTEEMFRAAEQNGVHLVEGYMYLYTAAYATMRRLVAVEKRIGTVLYVRGQNGFNLRDRPGHRSESSLSQGGGSMWDVGCYPLSYACGLLSEAVVDGSVLCRKLGTSNAAAGVAETRGETPDGATFATLKFPSGVVAHIHSAFMGPTRADFEIVGTGGRIVVSSPFKPFPESILELYEEPEGGSWTAAPSAPTKTTFPVKEPTQHLFLGELDTLSSLATANADDARYKEALSTAIHAKEVSLNTSRSMDLVLSLIQKSQL
jgi:xylose dehydrogenase (NAD/NADP)